FETANEDEDVPVFPIEQKKVFEASDNVVFETSIESGNDYAAISLGSNTYRYENGKIQKYLTDQAVWVNQETFVKIYKEAETGAFDSFNVGDTINIAFSSVNPPDDPYDIYHSIEGGIFDKNTKQANVKIIKKGTAHGQANTDYIVVRGFIAGFHGKGPGYGSYRVDEKLKGVSIERKAPDFANIVCESQNRLWACSRDGHEIYASSLGNPYNWYDYSGLSTDSYAVNVGTYGEFTGCINYLGRPLFFKENALHIISGSYPSNGGEIDGMSYSVATTTEFKGVEKGSEKSLAIIDNILYYKASAGIVAFDGTNTVVISDALGKEKYKNAVAGAYNNKYYVSMQDRNGLYHLFVYDTELGTWCREDNTHVLQFINVNNELLYLNADDNKIYSVTEENILNTTDYDKEGNFEWSCETGNFGYSYPNNKYLSRFQVRMQIADGAKATFFIQYDSNGVWHRKGEMTGKGIRTHLFPIIPVRCDHMKIKIVGKGDVKIFSISKILEEGGDV
ncbi:MAG: PQQ-like beta-propeller repeat protein, partial [Eubacterium sp.]|nr:PQQ-like beta-propeller repeat protein [Eubacterium sp.]